MNKIEFSFQKAEFCISAFPVQDLSLCRTLCWVMRVRPELSPSGRAKPRKRIQPVCSALLVHKPSLNLLLLLFFCLQTVNQKCFCLLLNKMSQGHTDESGEQSCVQAVPHLSSLCGRPESDHVAPRSLVNACLGLSPAVKASDCQRHFPFARGGYFECAHPAAGHVL